MTARPTTSSIFARSSASSVCRSARSPIATASCGDSPISDQPAARTSRAAFARLVGGEVGGPVIASAAVP